MDLLEAQREARRQLGDWISKQDHKTLIWFASRNSLRSLPGMGFQYPELSDQFALAIFRCNLISAAISNMHAENDAELTDAASFARAAVKNIQPSDDRKAEEANPRRTFTASLAWSASRNALLAVHSRSEAHEVALQYNFAAESDSADDPRAILYAACNDVSGPQTMHLLWRNSIAPEDISIGWSRARKYFSAHPRVWEFWVNWYEAVLGGTFDNWDLATEIAKIPDEVWTTGPEAVAARIEEIEAKRDLANALSELPKRETLAEFNRHGIGGNYPPDASEDAKELHNNAIIIWAAIDDLQEEVASEKPNRLRVETAVQQLSAGLSAIVRWAGRKGDLAVDTLIKSGAKSFWAYILANTEPFQKVIDAALHLLLLLSQ